MTVAYVIPAVTLLDIERFAPTGTVVTLEPGAYTITGMPTNIVVVPRDHEQSGTLFGEPVRIEFRAIDYTIAYGDGTTRTHAEPGRTWQQLDAAQFNETPTSHAYARAGTYRIDVSVRYRARVLFPSEGEWRDIDGAVTERIAPQRISVLDAESALVAHTCEERPSGKGC